MKRGRKKGGVKAEPTTTIAKRVKVRLKETLNERFNEAIRDLDPDYRGDTERPMSYE